LLTNAKAEKIKNRRRAETGSAESGPFPARLLGIVVGCGCIIPRGLWDFGGPRGEGRCDPRALVGMGGPEVRSGAGQPPKAFMAEGLVGLSGFLLGLSQIFLPCLLLAAWARCQARESERERERDAAVKCR